MNHIKLGLIAALGGSPWEIVACCDSTQVKTDGTDLWVTYNNLVWNTAGNPHSWIVLKQPGINNTGQGFQLCIDCSYAASTTENVWMGISWDQGFSGGTTTDRPTATDEVGVKAGTWGVSGTNYAWRVYVLRSSDGACTRIIITNATNSVVSSMWMFEVPKNPVGGWSTPVVYKVTFTPTYANWQDANGNLWIPFFTQDKGARPCRVATEGQLSGALARQSYLGVPDRSGRWLVQSLSIFPDNPVLGGKYGELFDWYFIPSNLPNGAYFTGGGPAWNYIVIEDTLLPWDGTQFEM